MEKTINIWEGFNFIERKGKSSLKYLEEQKNSFLSKTQGVIELDIESKNSSDFQTMTYDVYIVSNTLGGYRKKIISIIESERANYFPVTIMSPGLTDKVISFVEEKDFLDKLEEMLLVSTIKRTIENLYIQSKENSK